MYSRKNTTVYNKEKNDRILLPHGRDTKSIYVVRIMSTLTTTLPKIWIIVAGGWEGKCVCGFENRVSGRTKFLIFHCGKFRQSLKNQVAAV